ncbi:RING-H2 finger protein ATL79-like [Phragmites australis]|uniref:RING-H2 finger protein ATL79-like n=1 Tax=Phragmites australis TaxID=29695 RepID=UPI002D788A52|nr:RING-H2 finger protein ATL79-like [Phragmites australis]
MAMAPQGQEHEHAHHPEPNKAASIATNRWGPYSGAGDFARNMAVILAALLAALALALALIAAARYLLRRGRRGAAGRRGDGENNNNANADPEKPAVEPPPALVYSAAGTKLAGATAECAICLAEFVDGDAVRVMPACGHGFHARCIERWLAGGRRSTCPSCRAPAAPRAGGSQAEAAASST